MRDVCIDDSGGKYLERLSGIERLMEAVDTSFVDLDFDEEDGEDHTGNGEDA